MSLQYSMDYDFKKGEVCYNKYSIDYDFQKGGICHYSTP